MNERGYVSLYLLFNFIVCCLAAAFMLFSVPASVIRGNVIWREREEIKDRPDYGTRVYIFRENELVFQTLTDEKGEFKTDRLAPGSYIVYMVSGHVRRNVLEDDKTADTLRDKLWQYPEIDSTEVSYPVAYKVREIHIELEPLFTRVLNTDFGSTYISPHLETDIMRYELYHLK